MQQFAFLFFLVAGLAVGAPTDNNDSSSRDSPRPATGSGYAFAESCQAQLFAWRKSSTSFGSEYGHTSTSVFSSEMSVVSHEPETPTVTSMVTLCDGHARVVGQWTTNNGSSTTYNYQWTNSNPTFVMAPYPTPKPCSISPDDCELLYSSWTSHWDSITRNTPDFTEGLLDPPCQTSTQPEPTYSTNAHGKECNNCQIAGHQIRLLYWPVTTVDGSGDLCGKSAETITATTTGPPRSFVTDGITITSPTIGISISGLSRVDDCGMTVDHTIIPVLPDQVSSVEGARALFTHRLFNFADLNYKCMDEPDLDFVTTGTRTDCYREVPASAYFFGHANAAGVQWDRPGAFDNRTIWPNYQPQVLPPQTLTHAIRELWGEDCNIHPDGIWDPPIALQQANSFPLPKYVPGAPTQYYTPHTDGAQPGGPTTPNAPGPTKPIEPTAESQVKPSAPQPTQPHSHDGGWHGHEHEHEHGGHGEPQDGGQQDNDNGGQENHSGGEHGSEANGNDNEAQSGHEVVYTTVITYTSAGWGGQGGTEEHVVTATSVATSTSRHDDDEHASSVSGRQSPGDTQSTDQTSLTGASETVAGNDDSSTPTASANDGGISSAIQSGIGGGQNDNAQQQTNIAASLVKTIGSQMTMLAIFISVFL